MTSKARKNATQPKGTRRSEPTPSSAYQMIVRAVEAAAGVGTCPMTVIRRGFLPDRDRWTVAAVRAVAALEDLCGVALSGDIVLWPPRRDAFPGTVPIPANTAEYIQDTLTAAVRSARNPEALAVWDHRVAAALPGAAACAARLALLRYGEHLATAVPVSTAGDDAVVERLWGHEMHAAEDMELEAALASAQSALRQARLTITRLRRKARAKGVDLQPTTKA